MMWRQIIVGWSCALSVIAGTSGPTEALAQGSVSSGSLRPFVIAFVPVRGRRGGVGGVSVDAEGVVERAAVDARDLVAARKTLLRGDARSELRMISLKGLEQAFAECFRRNEALPAEMLFLAGLQRIEYVLAVPEARDIVLAGPAEDFRLDQDGMAIGVTSGLPAMRLDDLMEAFRTAEVGRHSTISCSIEPTPEGIVRLQRLLSDNRLTFNQRSTERMRKAVGPQTVTVSGVNSDSHFARVMVAADYLMKRLAMGLEASPVEGLPSYLELVSSSGIRPSATRSPRWWLAVDYLPLLRSEDASSWHIRGPGVKVLTEDTFFDGRGAAHGTTRSSDAAEEWATAMTERYEQLAVALPVFGQLRGCMDAAVAAALIKHHDLIGQVGGEFPLLMGGQLARGPKYPVPQSVDSQISVTRAGDQWIVGVSGGVDIDSWSVLAGAQVGKVQKGVARKTDQWWWSNQLTAAKVQPIQRSSSSHEAP